MKRDLVAPVRKAKNPISAAPTNRDLSQMTGNVLVMADQKQMDEAVPEQRIHSHGIIIMVKA
jgi:hypothetical protein